MAQALPVATLPRWLQSPAHVRAPQKAPPEGGPVPVERWTIPQELRFHKAWAVWRYELEHDRWSKPPYQPDGQRAEPSDPATWSEFDDAYEAYRDKKPHGLKPGRAYDGVSFALSPRWGIVGVDLDHVSEWPNQASGIIAALDSYTEVTPSRDGMRVFLKGTLPAGRRRRGNVEFYCERRFLTVTGHHLPGSPLKLERHDRALYALWDRWLNRG